MPGDIEMALTLLVVGRSWGVDVLAEAVTRLSLFASPPSQMREVANWLGGDHGADLEACAVAEQGLPQLALVDLELRGGATIVEAAVLRMRGERVQARVSMADDGVDLNVVGAWLVNAVVVAHNGDAFDFPVLERAGVPVPAQRIDTLRWSWLAFPDAPRHSLADVCELTHSSAQVERHTAAGDVDLLRSALSAITGAVGTLPELTRAALLVALDSHVDADVLTWLLGSPGVSPVPTWTSEWQAASPKARPSTQRYVQVADLALWRVADETSLVAAADVRGVPGEIPGRWAAGSRLIDEAALLTDLSGGSWPAAVAWRVCETGTGMLAYWPPSAGHLIKTIPTRPSGAYETANGPWLTDAESLLEEAPDRPLVLYDAVGLLLGGAHDRFDPALCDVEVTAVVEHAGPRRAEMSAFWAGLLGHPVSIAGTPRPVVASVTFVEGVPGTARAHIAASRTAAVAATRAEATSTVLVTSADRARLITDVLKRPWRERVGTSLLRPPAWPTVGETARRMRERPHLAVATLGTAAQIAGDGVELVLDRVGVPSLVNPLVERLLDDASDPFGEVIEPAAALRFLSILTRARGHVWICDPTGDSPLLRAALASTSGIGRQPIEPLESTPIGKFVAELLLSVAPDDGGNPLDHLDWAVERVLGPEGVLHPEQASVIHSLLEEHDTLAVFRTGFGKSLCYQAPGLALAAAGRGSALIVSPLIALQRDQVRSLHRRRVWEATALNSALDPLTRGATLRGISAGFYRLIYGAPEGLESPGLRAAIGTSGLSMVAVDEAHCITEMGHDFRPSYRTIPASIRRLMGVAEGIPLEAVAGRPLVMALTGTASPQTRDDIVEQLDVPFRVHVDSAFVRPELRFAVRLIDEHVAPMSTEAAPIQDRHPARWAALVEVLAGTHLPGIIYVPTQADTHDLAHALRGQLGFPVEAYNAGLEAADRARVEAMFLDGEVQLIVATNAFGMGIDKDDIRLVVHWRMPGSPESLYQEAGRAGRGADGWVADCVVLYSPDDLNTAARIRSRGIPSAGELTSLWATLEEHNQLQGSSERAIVTEHDLQVQAGLRPSVDVNVALAHLARVGLIKQVERRPASVTCHRTQKPESPDLPAVERRLLQLLPVDGRSIPIVTGAVAEQAAIVGEAVSSGEVWAALRHLERVGAIVLDPPGISVRALSADPAAVVASGWADMRVVESAIRKGTQSTEWYGPTPKDTGLAADRIIRAVEVMAALGCVRVAGKANDGALPRLRKTNVSMTTLKPIARVADAVVRAATESSDNLADLAALADECGVGVAVVRDVLVSGHLFNAISLDQRRWEDPDSPHLCQVIDLQTDLDPAEAIAAATAAARVRGHGDELRRRALHTYATLPIEDPTDPEAGLIYQQFLERYFTDPMFLADLEARDADALLEDLDVEQRAGVEAGIGAVGLRAGAGTGKTRTLTRRIAYRAATGAVVPSEVVAVCFGKDAAGEMVTRLAALGVTGARVKNLNAFGWQIVRDYWPRLGRPGVPEVESNSLPRLRAVLEQLGITGNPVGVAKGIALAKARLEEADGTISVASLELAGLTAEDFRRVYQGYEAGLIGDEVVDFQDQILLAVRLLGDDTVGDHLRSSIAEVYVDEAQDLSPAQWALVSGISKDKTLTVVGDPRQAIFEWNGASPELFNAFLTRPGTYVVDLTRNYRSLPGLLELPNQLMAQYPSLMAMADGDAETITTSVDDHDAAVLATVRAWLDDGVPDDEIAVLAFANASVDRLARVLRDGEITVRELGVQPLPHTLAFRIAKPLIDDEYEVDGDEGVEALMGRLADREDVINPILAGAPSTVGDSTPWDDWHRLTAELIDRERNGEADPRRSMQAIARDGARRSESGVVVTTITKSKGLEWDAVVLADASRKSFRGSDADRRLLYVGLTRARFRRLVIAANDDGGLPPMIVTART
ncbi:MAG: RecQ family ATP-dependent DNA helicase [Actinomycetota bacterium]